MLSMCRGSEVAAFFDNLRCLNQATGTRRKLQIKAPQIIKELAKTRFKATIGEDEGCLTVRLIIQPKMTTDDWLLQLLQFIMALGQIIQADDSKEKEH